MSIGIILPKVLEAEEERILLERKDYDEKSKKKLVEGNLRLVLWVAKKFKGEHDIEDLFSIGTIGLIKAIHNFDIRKNIKLSTYAIKCIENEIKCYIIKNQTVKKLEICIPHVSNDENTLSLENLFINDEDICFNIVDSHEKMQILLEAIDSLNEREKEIIQMKIGLNGFKKIPVKEIILKLGISRACFFSLQKKIYQKLKKYLKEKGITELHDYCQLN